jgi:acyl-CoA oxidase
LPGIDVGDCGAKIGFNYVDNGYVSFDHVRIPRTHLLSRYCDVDKEGTFAMKGDYRMIY